MNNYVLDLGFVAFVNWWQFGAVTILTILYFTANVIPAFIILYGCLKEREFWHTPLVFMTFLVPIIGSLFGMQLMEDLFGWDKIYLVQIYIFIAIVIGVSFLCL